MERTFPEAAPSIAPVAAALADPSRAVMCTALMDGRAWTPGELATLCGIARSTATEHLHRLAEAGITVDVRQGKHRYVTLAGDQIAELLERLAAVSGHTLPTAPSLSASDRTRRFREGRTCYKHLAGRLGLHLTDALRSHGHLDEDWRLTGAGTAWAARHRLDLSEHRGKPCLDTTERRPHLAGPLGVSLCAALFAQRWISRIGDGRAIRLTPDGRGNLRDLLQLA
ncbi:MAG: ArsR/SmtB family transcription factor [Brevibacterium sp.]|uniref:ArsR/SmtB family transcription factor n=1 Tax=Micrococcales TaxID=85006 RepID=UPI003F91DEF1